MGVSFTALCSFKQDSFKSSFTRFILTQFKQDKREVTTKEGGGEIQSFHMIDDQVRKGLITIVFVGSLGVTVDSTRLSVRSPASVSQAKVCVQSLIDVPVFFWTAKNNMRE